MFDGQPRERGTQQNIVGARRKPVRSFPLSYLQCYYSLPFGLTIEISFIATFTQRYFGK